MSHIGFQPRGATVEVEADYCVVGSGAGGATAAVTLARAGAKVVLVEAGPYREPADYPASAYGMMRDMLDLWGSNFTRGRAYWPIVQGRLVGGSTVINSAICVRTPGDILTAWQRDHGFERPERLLEIEDELESELQAEPVPPGALGHSNRLALEGDEKLAYHGGRTVRYVKDCRGDGQCLQGCRADRKQSLNRNYVPELLQRDGVVLSCAPVARVVMEGARAVGVRGRFKHPQHRAVGAAFTVRARKGVMIAASVTYSAALLIRSGIKLPALGRGFRAHPGTPVIGVYDEPVRMNEGATQGWASTRFRTDPGFKLETLSLPLDMIAGRLAGAGTGLMQRLARFQHMAMWIQATRAESVGRIRPAFGGRSVIEYTLDRADMDRFVAGMVAVARLHFAAGAKVVLPGVHGLPAELGQDDIAVLEAAPRDPRAYVAIVSHLFGGCTLGRDPARSVVDPLGRVHGHAALHVVDASVFPTNLGVNPQHTIMAVARHFAERAVDASAPSRMSA